MMMKKKFKEQDETFENDQNKATENKENIKTPQDSVETGSVTVDAGGEAAPVKENGTSGKAETDKVSSELNELQVKLAEMQDKYIRLSAEFDNYRKRTLREKMDLSKYAGENLLLRIIPVMDDFERAISHIGDSADCTAIKDGIDLIYIKLKEFLKQNGVTEIESLNSDFNVDIHEAVAKIPVDEEERKGKVVDVVQKGYYIQDKVLRFSKVVIGE